MKIKNITKDVSEFARFAKLSASPFEGSNWEAFRRGILVGIESARRRKEVSADELEVIRHHAESPFEGISEVEFYYRMGFAAAISLVHASEVRRMHADYTTQ